MKAIIFDLDGTLWDSSETIANAWKEILSQRSDFEKNLITMETIKSVLGKTNDEIIKELFPYISYDDASSILEKCQGNENSMIKRIGGNLFEGVEEMLPTLHRNYDLYIVSNCQSGYIEAFLEYYKLQNYFSDYECSGNTGKEKADNIRMIIERNQILDAIYIGDTEKDYFASKTNNLIFVWAKYGFGICNEYDYCLTKFEELKKILQFY